MNWYLKVFKQYADFNGRARRTEIWMFILFNAIFGGVAAVLDQVLGTQFISSLYGLVLLVPSLAVGVRRLHDIGKSGWMVLVSFIPIVGWIWLIVLYAKEGDHGVNEYGVDPKAGV